MVIISTQAQGLGKENPRDGRTTASTCARACSNQLESHAITYLEIRGDIPENDAYHTSRIPSVRLVPGFQVPIPIPGRRFGQVDRCRVAKGAIGGRITELRGQR